MCSGYGIFLLETSLSPGKRVEEARAAFDGAQANLREHEAAVEIAETAYNRACTAFFDAWRPFKKLRDELPKKKGSAEYETLWQQKSEADLRQQACAREADYYKNELKIATERVTLDRKLIASARIELEAALQAQQDSSAFGC